MESDSAGGHRGEDHDRRTPQKGEDYIGGETFCFTYGDGVCDIDIRQLVEFHRLQDTLATLTAVRPPGRFGAISLRAGENRITSFREKPKGRQGVDQLGGFSSSNRPLSTTSTMI
ncbi:MAG: sugar phosphate nucleotidyltransferase [Thermodesulfovibrionales bacterium]